MKKLAVTIFVVVAAASVVAAHAGEWITFRSPKGLYTVLFPEEPTLSAQEAPASTGGKLTQYLAMTQESTAVYFVSYSDLQQGMTFSLDKSRDGIVKTMSGILADEK